MIHTTTLKNGIKVVAEHMPYLHTVSFGVWVKAGSAYESVTNNGMSHVIEHMLFKGTESRTAGEIADEITAIGDQVNAFTAKECTAYYGVTLEEYLPRLICLLGDMLTHSIFEEEAMKRELSVILDEIDMYEDAPEELVHEWLQKNVWKDQPLGFLISGEKQTVSGFTKDAAKQFMEHFYYGENIVISVAGKFDEAQMLSCVEKEFRDIQKHHTCDDSCKSMNTYENEAPAPTYLPCFVTKHKNIEQMHMNLAFPTVKEYADERYQAAVLNAYLGGSNNSLLFQSIREDLGLAYSVCSYGSSYEKTGLMQIDVTMNPKQTTQVFEEILRIIRDIRNNPPKESVITAMGNLIRTEVIMGRESAKGRMESNAKSMLMLGRIVDTKEILDGLSAVSKENLSLFTSRYLDLNQISICMVGDFKREEKKIKQTWEMLTK